jgi:NADH-quinone oxidoreductase subunit A
VVSGQLNRLELYHEEKKFDSPKTTFLATFLAIAPTIRRKYVHAHVLSGGFLDLSGHEPNMRLKEYSAYDSLPSGTDMLLADAVRTTAGIEAAFSLADYYPILIFLGVVIAFALGTLVASQLTHLLGLKPLKKTAVKLMPYESGMDPVGSATMQFDVKFYLIAILFLVFDVELLFLYPWAVTAYSSGTDAVWKEMFGRIVFWEIIAFNISLAVGYVYAWRKGVFEWK